MPSSYPTTPGSVPPGVTIAILPGPNAPALRSVGSSPFFCFGFKPAEWLACVRLFISFFFIRGGYTPRAGVLYFFFSILFSKVGLLFFFVGYFFLTFFLLSLTFERQEKAGKDRKRSKKERAREKAGIAPPARPRRACEGACPPYTCVALPHPPLSPAVCLHARCPTRDCA